MSANVDAKRSAIETSAREIENKINIYTLSVKKTWQKISARNRLKIYKLQKKEKISKEWMISRKNIEEKLNQLQQMSDIISANLESKPHISLFYPNK